MPGKALYPETTKSQADKAGRLIREYLSGRTVLDSPELTKVVVAINGWRSMHTYPLSLVTPGVRNWVSRTTAGRVTVGQRLKRFDRIVFKLDRFPSMRLSQMEDVAGCRAVLETPAEVEAIAKKIRRSWNVREESDYRQHGKPGTGYRGLHITVVRRERLVEVQLRTLGQQYWAEQAERLSSRTDFNLKDGEATPDMLEYFKVASDLIWQQEAGMPFDKDRQEQLSKLRELVRPYFR